MGDYEKENVNIGLDEPAYHPSNILLFNHHFYAFETFSETNKMGNGISGTC